MLLATMIPVNLQVVVRCRPLNEKEKQDGRERIVDMDARQGQVAVSRSVSAWHVADAIRLRDAGGLQQVPVQAMMLHDPTTGV